MLSLALTTNTMYLFDTASPGPTHSTQRKLSISCVCGYSSDMAARYSKSQSCLHSIMFLSARWSSAAPGLCGLCARGFHAVRCRALYGRCEHTSRSLVPGHGFHACCWLVCAFHRAPPVAINAHRSSKLAHLCVRPQELEALAFARRLVE